MNSYLKAMRLGRWPRSLAIYMGTAAFLFFNREIFQSVPIIRFLFRCFFAYILTWAISTANYIINEIVDAPYDAHHPTKKNRPLLKGEINKKIFLAIGLGIIFLSLFSAYFFFHPRPLFYSLLALLIAGFIYNIKPIRAKDIPFLDSISESINNPIRFLIGWYVLAPADSFPPLSILLCWWAFGNFLMIAKRLSEFRLLKENAGNYRASLEKYTKKSLLLGMAMSTVLFFAPYFYFAVKFKLQSFLYLSPFIFFFFFLIYKKTLREKEVMEEPEGLIQHPKFALYTFLLTLVFFLSYFLDSVGQ